MMKYYVNLFAIGSLLALATVVAAQTDATAEGIALYRAGNFEKAVEVLQARVQAEPKDRVAWLYLGGSYVHLDKQNEAQKAFGKTNFVQKTGSAMTYDKPLKITYKPRVRYSEQARRNMSSGNVRVMVECRADGTIGFVIPVRGMMPDLEYLAVEAARSIRFEPAVQNGQPVTVITTIEYGFYVG